MKGPENITSLKGIGEKTARLFNRLGIYTTQELLSYYPRGYETFEAPVKNGNPGVVSLRGFQMEKGKQSFYRNRALQRRGKQNFPYLF